MCWGQHVLQNCTATYLLPYLGPGLTAKYGGWYVLQIGWFMKFCTIIRNFAKELLGNSWNFAKRFFINNLVAKHADRCHGKGEKPNTVLLCTLCQKSVNVAGISSYTIEVPNIFCRQSHFLIYSVLLPNIWVVSNRNFRCENTVYFAFALNWIIVFVGCFIFLEKEKCNITNQIFKNFYTNCTIHL
jgi:hypothetical protein